MKKYIVTLSALLISFSFLWNSFGNYNTDVSHCNTTWKNYETCIKNTYVKNVILQKRVLEKKIINGKAYVQSLDTFIKQNSTNQEKLEQVKQRAETAISKLWDSKKDQDIKELLKYLIYKINYVAPIVTQSGDETQEVKIEELVVQAPTKTETTVTKTPVLNTYEAIFSMSEENFQRYIEAQPISELETIVTSFYWEEDEIYKQILETYGTQTEKAKDTGRLSDIKFLQAGIEQVYQDTAEYPSQDRFNELVGDYVYRIPKDPLAGYTINNCNFWYKYEVWNDDNNTVNQSYRISTCFENDEYTQKRALNNLDNWIDNLRFEIWTWWENFQPTETFYINGVTSWEIYYEPLKENTGSLESIDDETKREFFYYLLAIKYFEKNPVLLEWYSRDARNSKNISDTRTLASVIETYITMGSIWIDEIIGVTLDEQTLNGVYSQVGYPNYQKLQVKQDDFSDSSGNQYIFWYMTDGEDFFYQILTFIATEEGKQQVYIKWNYVPKNNNYPRSLFLDTRTVEYLYQDMTVSPINASDIKSATIK